MYKCYNSTQAASVVYKFSFPNIIFLSLDGTTQHKFEIHVQSLWQMAWKKQYPMSINLKIKIEEVYFVKLTDIENVHPKRICHKCYLQLIMLAKGKKQHL